MFYFARIHNKLNCCPTNMYNNYSTFILLNLYEVFVK